MTRTMSHFFALTALMALGGAHAREPDVAPVKNATYESECGACHFAYPPGLLPERSWSRLLGNLSDHFGENAELPADTQKEIADYAAANAAGKSKSRISAKIMKSVAATETPLRITEITFIRLEHHELSRKMVADNPEVKSLSHCNRCHTHAAEGSFGEKEVKIPGFRNWEN